MEIPTITPSDWGVIRFIQMVPDFLYAIWSAIRHLFCCPPDPAPSPELALLGKKIEQLEPLTPQELRCAITDETLSHAPEIERLRNLFVDSLQPGPYIFITSRMTQRAITEKRFTAAECFRYIFAKEAKHIGFLLKSETEELQISHLDGVHAIEPVKDPLTYAQCLLLRCDLPEPFNQTLQEQALIPQPNLRGMGGWVVLPYLFGHKNITPRAVDQIEFDELEMCSSYVAKTILIAMRKLNLDLPVGSHEALGRIDILRFFQLFSSMVKEIPPPKEIAERFPSPTHYLRRLITL